MTRGEIIEKAIIPQRDGESARIKTRDENIPINVAVSKLGIGRNKDAARKLKARRFGKGGVSREFGGKFGKAAQTAIDRLPASLTSAERQLFEDFIFKADDIGAFDKIHEHVIFSFQDADNSKTGLKIDGSITEAIPGAVHDPGVGYEFGTGTFFLNINYREEISKGGLKGYDPKTGFQKIYVSERAGVANGRPFSTANDLGGAEAFGNVSINDQPSLTRTVLQVSDGAPSFFTGLFPDQGKVTSAWRRGATMAFVQDGEVQAVDTIAPGGVSMLGPLGIGGLYQIGGDAWSQLWTGKLGYLAIGDGTDFPHSTFDPLVKELMDGLNAL